MKPILSLLVLAGSVGLARADGIGDRSRTVCVPLEMQLNKKAADITAADLAGVTELKLPHLHLPAFKDNDFAGLTKLKKLHFFSLFHKRGDPKEVVAINEKVFKDLSSLEELVIESDQLGLLPDNVFAGLTNLKVLELKNVTLNRVPTSLITLPKIEVVYYDGTGLSKEDYTTLKIALGDKLKAKR